MLKITGLKELERSYRTAATKMASAEARAVKRSGVTITANQSRAIGAIVNLKVSTIKRQIVAIRQPTPGDPKIVFEVRGQGIALREYGARQTKKGVSVLVLRGGGRKIVKHGFLAKGFGGNLQVFQRTGEPKRKALAGRYAKARYKREPIEKMFGPDVFNQYVKEAIQQAGVRTWRDRLPIELERETAFALKYAGLI
jgi:hypothetical protein